MILQQKLVYAGRRMPISYRIYPRRQLVVVQVTGRLGDEDGVDLERRLLEDPNHQPGMDFLIDAREIETLALTREGIVRAFDEARRNEARLWGRKVAIVATRDAAFGMSRVYQAMSMGGPSCIEVFRSASEAHRWLGLSAGVSKPVA